MQEVYFYTGEVKHHFIDVDLLNRRLLHDYLIPKNLHFYYLITPTFNVDTQSLEDIFNNIVIDNVILKQIYNKKCTILIDISVEPISTKNQINAFINLLELFGSRYKLSYSNFKVLTGNLIINQTIHNLNLRCEFIPYFFFYDFPQITIKNKNNGDWKNFIKYNRDLKGFDKKILCYNRRPKPHRKYLIYKISNNEILNNNTKLSFINNKKIIDYTKKFNVSAEENILINNFINNKEDIKIDSYDYLEVSRRTDIDVIKSTFLSLITESDINEDILFISEKTFKPIYTCQPFIILGNTGTLNYLKEFGFKTFDKWWDESYDDEPNLTNRIHKILNVLEFICNKSDEELLEILNEMEEILLHNQNLLMQEKELSFIKDLQKPKNSLI